MPSPQHEAFVAGLAKSGATPSVLPPAKHLQAMRQADAAAPLAPLPGFRATMIRHAGRPALEVAMEGADTKITVLYFHGGGYIFMSPRAFARVLAGIAKAGGCRCLAPDYRKAPEKPFPAALEDAIAAYRALLAEGVQPASIVLAGDSAGGGLALAATLELLKNGLPAPAAVTVISPWTDLTISGASAFDADDPVVGPAALDMMARTYLHGANPRDARASPLYADNLAALPPTLIVVGTREALLDDSRRFLGKARAAGAPIRLSEYDGVAHMWTFYDPTMPEAFAEIGAIVRDLDQD
jgi:acetyl esterase/lipase